MVENKRLSVNLPVNLHFYVQQVARENNITLTKWLTAAILEKMIREGDVEVMEHEEADEYRFF
jgi:hypothetical protein